MVDYLGATALSCDEHVMASVGRPGYDWLRDTGPRERPNLGDTRHERVAKKPVTTDIGLPYSGAVAGIGYARIV